MLLRHWSCRRLFQLVWTTYNSVLYVASSTTCSDYTGRSKCRGASGYNLQVCDDNEHNHASSKAASLATGQGASGFQTGCVGVYGSALPHRAVSITDRYQMRSSAVNTCSVVQTSSCLGDCSFAADALEHFASTSAPARLKPWVISRRICLWLHDCGAL